MFVVARSSRISRHHREALACLWITKPVWLESSPASGTLGAHSGHAIGAWTTSSFEDIRSFRNLGSLSAGRPGSAAASLVSPGPDRRTHRTTARPYYPDSPAARPHHDRTTARPTDFTTARPHDLDRPTARLHDRPHDHRPTDRLTDQAPDRPAARPTDRPRDRHGVARPDSPQLSASAWARSGPVVCSATPRRSRSRRRQASRGRCLSPHVSRTAPWGERGEVAPSACQSPSVAVRPSVLQGGRHRIKREAQQCQAAGRGRARTLVQPIVRAATCATCCVPSGAQIDRAISNLRRRGGVERQVGPSFDAPSHPIH